MITSSFEDLPGAMDDREEWRERERERERESGRSVMAARHDDDLTINATLKSTIALG